MLSFWRKWIFSSISLTFCSTFVIVISLLSYCSFNKISQANRMASLNLVSPKIPWWREPEISLWPLFECVPCHIRCMHVNRQTDTKMSRCLETRLYHPYNLIPLQIVQYIFYLHFHQNFVNFRKKILLQFDWSCFESTYHFSGELRSWQPLALPAKCTVYFSIIQFLYNLKSVW